MITKENGLRYAKLIHVSVDNGKLKTAYGFIWMYKSDYKLK